MNTPKRRGALFAAGLMTIALTATACGSGGGGSSSDEGAGKPVKGGTLNMLGIGDVDYVDPNITYYSAGAELARLFARSLFTFPAEEGKTNTVVPDVAEEVPTTDNGGISSDGKTYTIKLRDGVKWNTSPSRPVVADDFVRGVKRTCNPVQPYGGSVNYTTLIEGMEKFCADFAKLGADATPADLTKFIDSNELPGVTAKDDSTLVIKLVQPAAYFADMLALAAFSPAPVEVMKYKPGSAELGKHQVASGPYKIDKYDPTKTIELSRNPDWDASTDPVRKAYVDKIVIDETGDQSAIQQQLETNTKSADMAWDTFPTAQQVPGLQAKKDPNLTVSETSSSNPYIQYNFKSPNNNKAMSKPEFRQALSHAINRDNIIQVLGGKVLNEPLTHVLPPAIRGSEDTKDYYPYSVDKAKSLMSEAGVSKPTLKVLYRNDSNGSTKTFETLQEDLGKVGIKVTGVPANQADFYTKYLQSPEQAGEGAFDLAIAGWGSDWYGNAAKSYFSPLFAGKPAFPPNGSNFGFYDNPETNKLIDEASAAPDDKSDALWAEADKKVMEDAAFYPITSPKTANYHAKHLHNAVPMEAFQNYDPSNVWIEKAYQD